MMSSKSKAQQNLELSRRKAFFDLASDVMYHVYLLERRESSTARRVEMNSAKRHKTMTVKETLVEMISPEVENAEILVNW